MLNLVYLVNHVVHRSQVATVGDYFDLVDQMIADYSDQFEVAYLELTCTECQRTTVVHSGVVECQFCDPRRFLS